MSRLIRPFGRKNLLVGLSGNLRRCINWKEVIVIKIIVLTVEDLKLCNKKFIIKSKVYLARQRNIISAFPPFKKPNFLSRARKQGHNSESLAQGNSERYNINKTWEYRSRSTLVQKDAWRLMTLVSRIFNFSLGVSNNCITLFEKLNQDNWSY